MINVEIKYNPYLVKTEVFVNGKEIDSNSALKYVCDRRLQEWIEPRGKWKGLFAELRSSLGESEINIDFIGTSSDFQDLQYAGEHYGECFSCYALNHKNKEETKDNSPYEKMKELKKLYGELQEGPIDEFKTEDIKKDFENAVNSDFRIIVVAPISSGKSTLINAILSRDLLPAMNQATTAVITEIKDNDSLNDFYVSAEDNDGNMIAENQLATKELISELNFKKDPNDVDEKNALVRRIKIEGPIPNLPSDQLSTVFVDTPGGNNANNTEHEKLMDEAIDDENKSLILYVFTGDSVGTTQSDVILKKIANAMKNSVNGKQSRDRFLFVANRMDCVDYGKEPYEIVIDKIVEDLAKFGITEPNLFLVSAEATKLIRMKKNNENFTEDEEDKLEGYVKKLNRSARMLQKYASIPVHEKERQEQESQKYTELAATCDNDEKCIEFRTCVAEINSGIPAVEYAISEYLEKYALAIKIKSAHDAFMKKVIERNMIANCEKEWATSKEEFDSVKKELDEKQKKYDYNEKLREFRDKVECIKLDKTELTKEKVNVIKRMDDLVKNAPEKVKKSEAILLLNSFTKEMEKIGSGAQFALDNAFNNGVRKACQDIIDEYTVYLEQLRKEGYFNIGNYDMKKTMQFSKFDIRKPEDLINDKDFISKDKIKVGQHKEKKKGIVWAFVRIFSESGWKTVDDFADVEFIKVKDLFTNEISKIRHNLDTQIKNSTERTEADVQKLKNETMMRLKDLDQMVQTLMKEINELLQNQEVLKQKVEKNQEKSKWINQFVERVENLLTV